MPRKVIREVEQSDVSGIPASKPYVACCEPIINNTKKIARNPGDLNKAFLAPEILSPGVRIPCLLHSLAMLLAPLIFHRPTIPQAAITAIAGDALNMKRPALQAI